MKRQVFLVGHCGFDGPRLQQEIGEKLSDVDVIRVNSEDDLKRACESDGAVLCVNREPVGFTRDGLEIIRGICTDHANVRAMLVSDYPEAQQEAERLGAVKGFSKREIGKGSLTECIRAAMGKNDER